MFKGGVITDPEEIKRAERFYAEKEKPMREKIIKMIVSYELTLDEAQHILETVLRNIYEIEHKTVITDGMIEV